MVAEDAVTVEVVKRLLADYAPNLSVKDVRPARGGKLKSQIASYNELSRVTPVVLLTDLDAEVCPPVARQKLLRGIEQCKDFIVNIAVDEAETWLYADREGWASYLSVPIESVPDFCLKNMGGPHMRIEVAVPYKTSLHLTRTLIKNSSDREKVRQIESTDGRCKGKAYNLGVVPFIKTRWK